MGMHKNVLIANKNRKKGEQVNFSKHDNNKG